ncbi:MULTISPECIES: NAD(P)/FAD-dependent oxidoreductase [unclassified Neochlamydia]|uniref:NAD(P)/FAD-dependent oxidoreductase n=1 Tax=unclassified Neochlamydia TaxID=2643326 RepID=UPI001409B7BD|nr:hypothetical protein [Neochlamydia sp. AcF84]
MQRAEGKSNTAKRGWIAIDCFINSLKKAGVIFNENSLMAVNVSVETNLPGIYAVGELASNCCLPHGATHQGCVVGRHAAGKEVYTLYEAIPYGVLACPKTASAGVSLEEALRKGYQVEVKAFPLHALDKFQATYLIEGFTRIIKDKFTGKTLGAPRCGI